MRTRLQDLGFAFASDQVTLPTPCPEPPQLSKRKPDMFHLHAMMPKLVIVLHCHIPEAHSLRSRVEVLGF